MYPARLNAIYDILPSHFTCDFTWGDLFVRLFSKNSFRSFGLVCYLSCCCFEGKNGLYIN